MATEKQVSANRKNGSKGGVKTEAGKAISRLNARKHGIFASALTPQDSEEVYGIEEELIAALRPVGRVEEMLVEKLALTYLRMQRCARAEAEFHVRTWEEPNESLEPRRWENLQEMRSAGARAVAFDEEIFERMIKLVDLYDARLTNQFLKLIHEIERLQRSREARKEPERSVPQALDKATEEAPAEAPEEKPRIAPDGATTNTPAAAIASAPQDGNGHEADGQEGATADANRKNEPNLS